MDMDNSYFFLWQTTWYGFTSMLWCFLRQLFSYFVDLALPGSFRYFTPWSAWLIVNVLWFAWFNISDWMCPFVRLSFVLFIFQREAIYCVTTKQLLFFTWIKSCNHFFIFKFTHYSGRTKEALYHINSWGVLTWQ